MKKQVVIVIIIVLLFFLFLFLYGSPDNKSRKYIITQSKEISE